jgi:hypothetical protein
MPQIAKRPFMARTMVELGGAVKPHFADVGAPGLRTSGAAARGNGEILRRPHCPHVAD